MGLKVIGYGPYKVGKTGFAISMAEVGPVGIVDAEGRVRNYTIPHPSEKPGAFPFDKPRMIRPDMAWLPQTQNPLFLVESQLLQDSGRALEVWSKSENIYCLAQDSGSIMWDLLQDTRDDTDPRTSMLSWTPLKRVVRRLLYVLTRSGKHVLITAHAQDIVKKVGSEFVTIGTRPWLEKKTPHWADLTLEFGWPDSEPAPVARVAGEGVGGAGGLKRGVYIKAPTFGGVLKTVSYNDKPEPLEGVVLIDPDEVSYRNTLAVDAVNRAPVITGVDDEGR